MINRHIIMFDCKTDGINFDYTFNNLGPGQYIQYIVDQ
jgi:hypothetical protein